MKITELIVWVSILSATVAGLIIIMRDYFLIVN